MTTLIELLCILATTLALAGATTGIALFARALPWPTAWLDRKPLGCPVCMSGWSAFLVMAVAYNDYLHGWDACMALLAWGACIALSAPIFLQVYPPPLAFPTES